VRPGISRAERRKCIRARGSCGWPQKDNSSIQRKNWPDERPKPKSSLKQAGRRFYVQHAETFTNLNILSVVDKRGLRILRNVRDIVSEGSIGNEFDAQCEGQAES
jgi:hypothetical protein